MVPALPARRQWQSRRGLGSEPVPTAGRHQLRRTMGGINQLQRLISNAEWALAHGLDPRDLVPMLEQVVQRAEPGSDAALFALRHLAPLLVERSPWRAARMARDLLKHGEDGHTWAVLGLCHTMLGNYRCARLAYQRALAYEPGCAAYAHNLGHLLDVAFNRAADALRYLRAAHCSEPREPEIASSYAHALARAGQPVVARQVLRSALGGDEAAVDRLLADWVRADPPSSRIR